jgi:hypothetical protein
VSQWKILFLGLKCAVHFFLVLELDLKFH